MNFLQKLLNIVVEALFPKRCFFCETPNSLLCNTCTNSLQNSVAALDSGTHTVLSYQDESVRSLLHAFKFSRRKDLGEPLARILHDTLLEILAEQEVLNDFRDPLLIGIPMTKDEKRKRGYDQVDILCRHLSSLTQNELPYAPGILLKSKQTKSQSQTSSKRERFTNVRDCFCIASSHSLSNRNIILIDDIVTTGATLLEAKKVLRSAGSRQVLALTIAH